MPYNRYDGLDGKVKAFNRDKGVVWRRSPQMRDDRLEPYQSTLVYEVWHLLELPPRFVLIRVFSLLNELHLLSSEAARKHYTSREFRLMTASRAQRFLQAMGCELIHELYALSKTQKVQMPPVSESTVGNPGGTKS